MTATVPWTCPTCNGKVSTPYCAECGESPLDARDLTLRGLFGQLFHAFSSIDGRLIRSFQCLLHHPGALTLAYVRGQRVSYLGPFQLFVIANVLFVVVQSLTNANIFSTTLDAHLHRQDWSVLAQSLVADRLQATQMTLSRYAPVFDQAVAVNAKWLIILMVLSFSLLPPLLFYRNRQPFVTHVAFSLHLYAFLLLIFCVSLAVSAVDVLLGGAGLNGSRVDKILSGVNLVVCATYLYFATGAVYGATGVARVIKVLLLTVTTAAIVLGYRFVLFLITLYST